MFNPHVRHKLSVSTERGEILLDGENINSEITNCNIYMNNAHIAEVTLTFLANVEIDALCTVDENAISKGLQVSGDAIRQAICDMLAREKENSTGQSD